MMLIPVIFTVLLSGCVMTEYIQGGATTPAKKVYSPDVMVIENTKAIPSQVFAGSDFTLAFLIKHQGNPKSSDPAKNVKVIVYDWGLCKPKESSNNGIIELKTYKTFMPEQEEQLTMDFTAPLNDEIARMEYDCPIRFKVEYDYEGKTQVDIKVIDKETKKEQIRLGTYQTFYPTQVQGLGPVKIDINFYSEQPFEELSKQVLSIQLKNVGKGRIKDSKIENGKLIIEFPKGFKEITCDKMSCSGGKCKLKEDMQFIGESTQKIRCSFKVPEVEEEKTYYVKTFVKYTYEIDEEEEVKVKPTVEE